ncbi:MAG: hypothetical protein ABW174_07530 [Flavitalea sp.]
MKIFFSVALFSFLIAGCNFSVGTKKDFATGLSFDYKGFRVDNVVLVDSINQKLSSNQIPFNSRIGLMVDGISNFTAKDGLVYPGMTVEIFDKQGNPVVGQSPDLFAQNAGFTAKEASVLLGSAMLHAPMQAGGTYVVKTHVWDKNNPGNLLDAEVELLLK